MPKYLFKNFGEYWYSLTPAQRPLLARLSGIAYSYLFQIARGYRKAGHKTIMKLGKVDRRITPRLMRPDLMGKRKYVFRAPVPPTPKKGGGRKPEPL